MVHAREAALRFWGYSLNGRYIALVVLSTNNWAFVKAHIAGIMVAVEAATPGSYIEVKVPER